MNTLCFQPGQELVNMGTVSQIMEKGKNKKEIKNLLAGLTADISHTPLRVLQGQSSTDT